MVAADATAQWSQHHHQPTNSRGITNYKQQQQVQRHEVVARYMTAPQPPTPMTPEIKDSLSFILNHWWAGTYWSSGVSIQCSQWWCAVGDVLLVVVTRPL